jgi:hypothetical protein
LGKDSCVEIHKVGKGEDPRRNTGVFYLQEVLVRIPSECCLAVRITHT